MPKQNTPTLRFRSQRIQQQRGLRRGNSKTKFGNCFTLFSSDYKRSDPQFATLSVLNYSHYASEGWKNLSEEQKITYRWLYEILKQELSPEPQDKYTGILNFVATPTTPNLHDPPPPNHQQKPTYSKYRLY
ncbi:hypothetical protein RclHR1_01280004 [Rhizophagus clarus]|uniref:HMG box domain-containing protein n=1 Tax=Rhizophagus clarus TaxID=94130 RepID=A0A2Z6Q8A1_9GLOM|nr:hypothetical protein RclHR1_01280004 [Rhizophagus clarus]GES76394.1 hypothetical protein RCL_jg26273.t1 [Rhizophagus clarus]